VQITTTRRTETSDSLIVTVNNAVDYRKWWIAQSSITHRITTFFGDLNKNYWYIIKGRTSLS
jgi:hypothetical protein